MIYPSRLLIESNSGKWCYYSRNPELIPTPVKINAKTIYDLIDRKYIKGYNILPMYIGNLPIAEHVLAYNNLVVGIKFDDEYIGLWGK